MDFSTQQTEMKERCTSLNQDLELAIKTLEGGYTLVLCKGDTVYTSHLRGVKALLDYIDRGVSLTDFASADKVVGKGAAFLYVLLGVKSVYAPVISKSAKSILERFGIFVCCDTLVERIINRTGDGFCPIESAVFTCEDPNEALILIKERLRQNDLQKIQKA